MKQLLLATTMLGFALAPSLAESKIDTSGPYQSKFTRTSNDTLSTNSPAPKSATETSNQTAPTASTDNRLAQSGGSGSGAGGSGTGGGAIAAAHQQARPQQTRQLVLVVLQQMTIDRHKHNRSNHRQYNGFPFRA
jgi:hypothetical protein